MRTRASIAGHPLHPMLIPVPIGLWIFSLICDLFSLAPNASENWQTVAFFTMAGGVVGAFVAAIPGIVDMLSLPAQPKRIALIHMSFNVAVIIVYLINLWQRSHGDQSMLPLWLSLAGVALLGVSGWLGGKMVYEHGVGMSGPSPRDS